MTIHVKIDNMIFTYEQQTERERERDVAWLFNSKDQTVQ